MENCFPPFTMNFYVLSNLFGKTFLAQLFIILVFFTFFLQVVAAIVGAANVGNRKCRSRKCWGRKCWSRKCRAILVSTQWLKMLTFALHQHFFFIQQAIQYSFRMSKIHSFYKFKSSNFKVIPSNLAGIALYHCAAKFQTIFRI